MIGSDFELFLQTADTGEFVPEFFLNLPDKGAEHIPLTHEGEHVGFIHRDNVSVELCSLVASASNFAQSVSRTLAGAQAWLDTHARGLIAGRKTTVRLTHSQQQHPNARELGCDIDFLSDMQAEASEPRQALNANLLGDLRHAGGHVHVSYDTATTPAWIGSLLCDLFIGIPAIPELDQERAQWYGYRSLHRPTQYPSGHTGVEYRALDSGWVHEEESRNRVARGAGIVQDVLDTGDRDLIMQFLRICSPLRRYTYLIDIPDDLAFALYDEAIALAQPVSEWAL